MRSFDHGIYISGVTLRILTIYPPVSGIESLTTEPQSDWSLLWENQLLCHYL